ncbi:BCCT family transporter [Halopenitus sp. POP-27]|uniref:BCCT family transporter n=1 Tax=Halopenitus sp. POP-27 TaxID=2994425 RepID=UPI0024686E2B|nr:BCCT family transporter [Halopenitus sp. POP-27]
MSTRDTPVERALRAMLVPVFVLSGIVVVSGFFFPWVVGSVVSGRGWVVVALVFFGTGLSWLALLPARAADGPEADAAGAQDPTVRRLLYIRHGRFRPVFLPFVERQDRIVFWVPIIGTLAFFLAWIGAPNATGAAVEAVTGFVFTDLAWLFLATVLLSVLFCAALVVGPWGSVRLGGADAEPSYTYPTYFALFFAAGIAAGIVFWGPAESLFHYRTPPPYFDAAPLSAAAIDGALAYALFHWGVSAWSTYLVVGLPIAYFVHDRGAPLRVSTVLAPFVGIDRLDSWWARAVDVLAVFATVGGVGTSIAFVGRQFLVGIEYQWDVITGAFGPIALVVGLTATAVIAAATGVHRGIRRLSGVTIALFAAFVLVLLAVGPRSFVLERGGRALGIYVVEFVPLSLFRDGGWVVDWTVWNWAWWFSWAPFAGLFLAAVSRGRTVRTVTVTAVGATALASMTWFLVMGGTTLALQHAGRANVLNAVDAYGGSEAVAGFPVLAALPMSRLLLLAFLALIVVFIATSAAVSTLVVSVLATKRGHAPTTGSIVLWGVIQGVVAAAVLLLGNAQALQDVAVLAGAPVAVLAIAAMGGLAATFRRDERGHRSAIGELRHALERREIELVPERPDLHDMDPPGPSGRDRSEPASADGTDGTDGETDGVEDEGVDAERDRSDRG